MPDILPVSMQDLLHSGQPELREGEIIVSHRAHNGREWRKSMIKKGQARHTMYDGSARLRVYQQFSQNGGIAEYNIMSQENNRDTSVYQ